MIVYSLDFGGISETVLCEWVFEDGCWHLKTITNMIKESELRSSKSCLNKADEDEMLFVLRAQDESAPKVVLHWIAKNFETAPEEKLVEAFQCALKMRDWHNRKKPD